VTQEDLVFMRKLVDVCYQEFMEQPNSVPSTQWADELIEKALKDRKGSGNEEVKE
jgi:hypothetical protein